MEWEDRSPAVVEGREVEVVTGPICLKTKDAAQLREERKPTPRVP